MSSKKEKTQASLVAAPVLAVAAPVESEANTDAKETAFAQPLVVKDTARVVIDGMDYTNSLSSKIPDNYLPEALLNACKGFIKSSQYEAMKAHSFSFLETDDLILVIDETSCLKFTNEKYGYALRGRFLDHTPTGKVKPVLLLVESEVEVNGLKGINVVINCEELTVGLLEDSTVAFEASKDERCWYLDSRVVTGVNRIQKSALFNTPLVCKKNNYSAICESILNKSDIAADTIHLDNADVNKSSVSNSPLFSVNNSRLTEVQISGVETRIVSKGNEGRHPTLFIENKNWRFYPHDDDSLSPGINSRPIISIQSPFDILSIDFGTRKFNAVSIRTNDHNQPAMLVFGYNDKVITLADLAGPFSNTKIRSIVLGRSKESENTESTLVEREMMEGLKEILKSRLRLLSVVNSVIYHL